MYYDVPADVVCCSFVHMRSDEPVLTPRHLANERRHFVLSVEDRISQR